MVLRLVTGGLERVVLNLVRGLVADGYPCMVYFLEAPGEWGHELEQIGAPTRLIKKQEGIDLSLPLRLARAYRQDGVALAHSHNIGPLLYTTLASRLSRVPLISTKHGRNDYNKWQELWLNRFAGFCCRAIVAVSDDAFQVARDIEHIPRRKLSMIHNGVVTDHPPADQARLVALRAEWGLEPGDLVIVNVARLSREKNHALLLEAFSRLLPQIPQAKLLLVGDGQERAFLRQTAANLGLDGRVIFAGMREGVPDILSLAHVFALTSHLEGLSISILEAMSAGLPVVATDVGGNRELVAPGRTGLLVPPRDVEKLQAALSQVLGDAGLRQRLGQAARQRARDEFSVQGMVRRYEELYQRLLA